MQNLNKQYMYMYLQTYITSAFTFNASSWGVYWFGLKATPNSAPEGILFHLFYLFISSSSSSSSSSYYYYYFYLQFYNTINPFMSNFP